jgi:hypothetical protein
MPGYIRDEGEEERLIRCHVPLRCCLSGGTDAEKLTCYNAGQNLKYL